MDLSQYIKKSNSNRVRADYSIEKKCLECGRKVEKEGNIFYLQSFCSADCKENYVASGGIEVNKRQFY